MDERRRIIIRAQVTNIEGCSSRESLPSAFGQHVLLHVLAHLPQFNPPQWSPMARPEKRKRLR